MPLDDALHNGGINGLVLVNGDVAEADHPAQPFGQRGVDQPTSFKKRKGLGRRIRSAEAFYGDDVGGKVDRRLNGPEQVDRGDVVDVDGQKTALRLTVDLGDARQTAVDDGELSRHDVAVNHGTPWRRGSARLRGGRSSRPRTC